MIRISILVVLYSILAVPLLVWNGFVFPHSTTKTLAFQALVELLWVLLLLDYWNQSPAKVGDNRARLKAWPFGLALGAFLLYSVVGAIVGIDTNRSLWGFIHRQDGLVLWFHFFMWFLAIRWIRNESATPVRKLKSQAGTGTPAGVFDLRRYLMVSYWICFVAAL